jgi:general stress protein 26
MTDAHERDDGENYEDVTSYTLDDDDETALLNGHDECTFIWSNKEGWPVGVIMSYLYHDGRFWLTASRQRKRIAAVERDPRVCVVVTSTGSDIPRNKTVTYKGTCVVHDDQATKDWFYPAFSAHLHRHRPERAAAFQSFLDSPRRVILEVVPTQRIGYDGAKMGVATAKWMAAHGQ